MSYSATVLKVMIASPSDVAEERKIITEVLYEWNAVHSESSGIILMPVSWETHANPGFGRPQGIINEQVLNGADLLVAAFWTRIGSNTGKAASGTIEEIEHHIEEGKPAMLYFSDAPVSLQKIDTKQTKALDKFKKECQKRSLFETYISTDDFRNKFKHHLGLAIPRYFKDKSAAITQVSAKANPHLSEEAQTLLIAGSKDKNGYIIVVHANEKLVIQSNNIDFTTNVSVREEAVWESAIQELVNNGLVRGNKSNVRTLKLTKKGYEMAESIQTIKE